MTTLIPARSPAPSGIRPEIQALRAIAVLAVVLYHLWPGRFPGGYVGVDVFFAISGFLIIGHLVRGIDRRGTFSLTAFWARRARRLLPASLLVIGATAVATLLFVPDVVWRQWFREMGASAIYVQNWLLAADSVDYLGADNAASPTQHFWSLSVEEQFYIVWPIVILVILAIARRAGLLDVRRVIGGALAVVAIASLAYSVWGVANDPSPTYFVTQGRAWEFAAGGLVALLASSSATAHPRARAAVSWAGLVALAAVIFLYDGGTPFPGFAAVVPVVATLAVIWSGTPAIRWAPSSLMRLRPIQWTGDISYSLYLWHWAPIVILPFATESDLGLLDRAVILVASFVMAYLTKRFVEDPFRTRIALVRKKPWVTLVATVAASAVVVAGCGAVTVVTTQRVERAAAAADAAIAEVNGCVGQFALVNASECPEPYAMTDLTDPAFAKTDIGKGVQVVDKCKQTLVDAELITCSIGETKDPTTTIALLGDSHAGVYLEPLDAYGKLHNLRFITMIKTWCAGTGAVDIFADGGTPESNVSCTEWGERAIDRIVSDDEIDGVIFANFTQAYAAPTGTNGRAMRAEDFTRAWDPILEADKTVVGIRDVPLAAGIVPDCIATHPGVYDACTNDRNVAVLDADRDPLLIAAREYSEVEVIDLTESLCDEKVCHSVIGGLVVYFDNHHLTATFARTMTTVLGSKLSDIIGR